MPALRERKKKKKQALSRALVTKTSKFEDLDMKHDRPSFLAAVVPKTRVLITFFTKFKS